MPSTSGRCITTGGTISCAAVDGGCFNVLPVCNSFVVVISVFFAIKVSDGFPATIGVAGQQFMTLGIDFDSFIDDLGVAHIGRQNFSMPSTIIKTSLHPNVSHS